MPNSTDWLFTSLTPRYGIRDSNAQISCTQASCISQRPHIQDYG